MDCWNIYIEVFVSSQHVVGRRWTLVHATFWMFQDVLQDSLDSCTSSDVDAVSSSTFADSSLVFTWHTILQDFVLKTDAHLAWVWVLSWPQIILRTILLHITCLLSASQSGLSTLYRLVLLVQRSIWFICTTVVGAPWSSILGIPGCQTLQHMSVQAWLFFFPFLSFLAAVIVCLCYSRNDMPNHTADKHHNRSAVPTYPSLKVNPTTLSKPKLDPANSFLVLRL